MLTQRDLAKKLGKKAANIIKRESDAPDEGGWLIPTEVRDDVLSGKISHEEFQKMLDEGKKNAMYKDKSGKWIIPIQEKFIDFIESQKGGNSNDK